MTLARFAVLSTLALVGAASRGLAQEIRTEEHPDSLSRLTLSPIEHTPSMVVAYEPRREDMVLTPSIPLSYRSQLGLSPARGLEGGSVVLPPMWTPHWQSMRLDALHRYDVLSLSLGSSVVTGLNLSGALQLGVRQLERERSYDVMGGVMASYRLSDQLGVYASGRIVLSPWEGDLYRGGVGLHWRGGRWELGAQLDYAEYLWLGHRMKTLALNPFLSYRISDRWSIHSTTHLPLHHQGYQPAVVNSTVIKWRFSRRWAVFAGTETYFDIRTRRVIVRPTGGFEYDASRK